MVVNDQDVHRLVIVTQVRLLLGIFIFVFLFVFDW